MSEKIRIAVVRIPCDICGQLIYPGERFRLVRDDYGGRYYREHIRCPGAPAVAISDPRPTPPKVITNFNHAQCIA